MYKLFKIFFLIIAFLIIFNYNFLFATDTCEINTSPVLNSKLIFDKNSSETLRNLSQEFLDIVADEVNIKEVKFIDSSKLYLNPDITPELKQEGSYREFVRAIQDMRKKMGLTPSDVISLVIETNDEGKKLIQKFESELLKTILASKIEFKQSDGETLKIDKLVFKVKIAKI